MLLSLFLDFSAGAARNLGGIMWKAALVLWLPQLLAIWLVLKRRDVRPLSRSAEVTRLLIPFILFVATLCAVPVVGLLLLMYADVDWGAWLLVLWLPTLLGIVIAVTTNTFRPEQAPKEPAPGPVGLPNWLIGVVTLAGILVMAVQWYQSNSGSAPLPTPHRWNPQDEEWRELQAREDSLRYQEQWGEKKPATQPW